MRRRPRPALKTADDVPAELALGPCIELYAPDNPFTAMRLFQRAREDWLTAAGIDVRDRSRWPESLRRDSSPWSFDYIAEHAPERLAERLARAGLPARWRPPSPATDLVIDAMKGKYRHRR